MSVPESFFPAKYIVFYDGACGLCHGVVRFLIRHDRQKTLRYASLQGRWAEWLQQQVPEENLQAMDSVLFYQNGLFYKRSEAIIRLFQHLGGWWSVVAWMRIVPRNWRDKLYNQIARKRYAWFGQKSVCACPCEDNKNLFID